MRKRLIVFLVCMSVFLTLVPNVNASPPVPPSAVLTHWAKAEIIDAYEMGLVDEWPAAPDAPVMRRQAARLLADGLGLAAMDGPLPFKDIAADDPDRLWFVTLNQAGIFRGNDQGLFMPDKPLSRAEFAAIIARSASGLLAERQDVPAFGDTSGHWAEEDIAAGCRLGLVNGVGDGLFDPERSVTLAETLAMVVRLIRGDPAPGLELAPDDDLTGLAILDLELWAKAYSQTPMPDWSHVCANRVGVALFIMKESAAVEDAYRRQGHTGAASVLSSTAQMVEKRPLSAIVTMQSTGISVWDGVPANIVDSADIYMRWYRGRWVIYKILTLEQ